MSIGEIIASVTAIIAIFISISQVRINNKQFLFDRRVKYFTILVDLYNLYEKNRKNLYDNINNEIEYIEIDTLFSFMTNNDYLYSITEVISNPLYNEKRKDFLSLLEKLKRISLKTRIVFRKMTIFNFRKRNITIGDFIYSYSELLFQMYSYKIILIRMDKTNNKNPDGTSLKYTKKITKEADMRKELIKSLNNIERAYKKIVKENILEKTQKQIQF